MLFRSPKLLALQSGAVVWTKRKQDDTDAVAAARTRVEAAARDEYRRLLYVAMTRAAERLIVCGTQGDRQVPDGCWYQLVRKALEGDCVSEPADDGAGEVLRYRKSEAQPPQQTVATEPTAMPSVIPAWLTRDAPREQPSARTITPSSPGEETTRRAPAPASRNALLRGSLTHRLLQALPNIPASRRADAARGYLARAGGELAPRECARIAEQVLQLTGQPDFADLFGAGSRAEVPIVGQLTLGRERVRVSGQIDRLVVTREAVLIADFKTDRAPPARPEDCPDGYVRQLALYRALLMRLYPDRPVRAALVFTETPVLIALSATMLDAALAGQARVSMP